MGKESKLRKFRSGETRYSDENGNRKLYDRDKAPDGCDFDVWHLAIYFEQEAETDRMPCAGRPILYTELNHRINESKIRIDHPDDWIDIAEHMINAFWFGAEKDYSINSFCSSERFDYYLRWVLDSIERKELTATGVRIKAKEREVKPARREPQETEALKIINRKYTEEELQSKIDEFRTRG